MREFIADLLACICIGMLWTTAECVADWHGDAMAVTVTLMYVYTGLVFGLLIAATIEKAAYERRIP